VRAVSGIFGRIAGNAIGNGQWKIEEIVKEPCSFPTHILNAEPYLEPAMTSRTFLATSDFGGRHILKLL
jgi:hypothetical protein